MPTETLRELVTTNYDVHAPVDITILSNALNEVHLVEGSSWKTVLRIARTGRYQHFDESAYRYELDLLVFLQSRGVPVSYPLARANGDLIGSHPTPDGPRHFAMFSFAEGDIQFDVEPAQASRIGRQLAEVHLAADDFKSAHKRFRYDEATLFDKPASYLQDSTPGQVSADDVSFLLDVAERSKRAMAGVRPQSPSEYGAIHGDFHMRNVHLDSADSPTIFDFDFCGPGWRAYDLVSFRGSAALNAVAPLPNEVSTAFLAGYEEQRPISDSERELMPHLLIGRILFIVGLWLHYHDTIESLYPGYFGTHMSGAIQILRELAE